MDEKNNNLVFSVGDFLGLVNQNLEYAFTSITIEGEVSQFKINQNKFVFFDLKDSEGTVSCFMTIWQLRTPIEDGMRVRVLATPKVTDWGKFSLTVQNIQPIGEGDLKKSAEILFKKLSQEGLFAPERKRLLPKIPSKVAVIASVESAGYADFMKIAKERWGGVEFVVYHVQVQGLGASDQAVESLKKANQLDDLPDMAVIIRGGGSADDLASFNDEILVREVAASRIPVVTGIGHEIDETLVDFAADFRASTPSNAAEIIFPDKKVFIERIKDNLNWALDQIQENVSGAEDLVNDKIEEMNVVLDDKITKTLQDVNRKKDILSALDPSKVLARGYAIVRGEILVGKEIEINLKDKKVIAEVKSYE